MHGGQWKSASRANPAAPDPIEGSRKAALAIEARNDQCLLVLVNPPRDAFLSRNIRARATLHFLASFREMPSDLVTLFVVLNDADTVEFDHTAELVPKNRKQLRRIAVRTNCLQNTDEGFVTRGSLFEKGRRLRCHEHRQLDLPEIEIQMQMRASRIQGLLLFRYRRSRCHCHFRTCFEECRSGRSFAKTKEIRGFGKVRVCRAICIMSPSSMN